MSHSTNNGNRAKAFLLEDIPLGVHKVWKALATTNDLSMRDFALKAIEEKIERDLKHLNKDYDSAGN